ncbi:hypothetical protein MRB53_026229 [Persea americana]|uniref:Uncharacterized protein n=1 Tax=Persea americana TaxID=3435 RepID=A0ACC2LIE2_PERAE|nr:hypothetical protein MRB53_026229 [Persea americana]
MNVVNAEKDEVNGCHRDEYLYGIEELQETESVSRCKEYIWIQDISTQKKVDRFLDWQLESFEKLEKMVDPSQMNSFVKSMQRKVETFKKAWSSGFVSFKVDCINSTFDEEGKVDVRSPSPNTPVGSLDGFYGLSPVPHTSTHMFHSPHSTMTPIHVSTPQSVRS